MLTHGLFAVASLLVIHLLKCLFTQYLLIFVGTVTLVFFPTIHMAYKLSSQFDTKKVINLPISHINCGGTALQSKVIFNNILS